MQYYVDRLNFIVVDKASHDKAKLNGSIEKDYSDLDVMDFESSREYLPQNKPKSEEELSLAEKQWRDSELSIYIDHFQKTLVWADLTADEQLNVATYRRVLLDYPESEDFKAQSRPVRPESPVLE